MAMRSGRSAKSFFSMSVRDSAIDLARLSQEVADLRDRVSRLEGMLAPRSTPPTGSCRSDGLNSRWSNKAGSQLRSRRERTRGVNLRSYLRYSGADGTKENGVRT